MHFPSDLSPSYVVPQFSVSAGNSNFCPQKCSSIFPPSERSLPLWMPSHALLNQNLPEDLLLRGDADTSAAVVKAEQSSLLKAKSNPSDFFYACISVLVFLLPSCMRHEFVHQTCIPVTLLSTVFNLRHIKQLSFPSIFWVFKKRNDALIEW